MSELSSIFQSIKRNTPKDRSQSKEKPKASKKTNAANTNKKAEKISLGSRKKQKRFEQRQKSKNQLRSLPNTILIPKCSLCHYKLVLQRGDQCYDDYASVDCDYCGREDIHGEVWHCNRCANQAGANGFNLCRTCGYLISNQRHSEIRRVAPPEDDMGLLFNRSGIRNRSTTLDGINIFKHDEIKKTLKIGIGGGTKLCPFDCMCCF